MYEHNGKITADCSKRSLTSVPESLPDGVTRLMVNQNSISDVSAISRYQELQVLEANQNLLVRVDWQSLSDSLQELYLSKNNITNLCGEHTALMYSSGMLVLLSLMGALWGLAWNITRLRFLYTVIKRIKMPKRADFHRDAYVAYCDADTDFVCGRLKRQLQDRRAVRLLIKDLPVDAAGTRFYQLPGDNVALNMLEHIDLCWKVILVVTPSLTRDSMVGFMTRAALQSITDRMPHRVLLLCVGMREVPELTSLKALLEAVPEHQVFFLPQHGEDYCQV